MRLKYQRPNSTELILNRDSSDQAATVLDKYIRSSCEESEVYK